jgi:hypothetical protein
MKIFSNKEGENWLQSHQLPIKGAELRVLYKKSMVYQYDKHAQSEIVLAKLIADYVRDIGEEVAFWITGWTIENENMNLFNRFRKGMNEERTLREASFHIFDKSEVADLESLMDLAMFFTWDSYLILPNRGIVFSPNDDFLHVTCKEEGDAKKFKEFFEQLKYKDITEYWRDRMAKLKEIKNS